MKAKTVLFFMIFVLTVVTILADTIYGDASILRSLNNLVALLLSGAVQ